MQNAHLSFRQNKPTKCARFIAHASAKKCFVQNKNHAWPQDSCRIRLFSPSLLCWRKFNLLVQAKLCYTEHIQYTIIGQKQSDI